MADDEDFSSFKGNFLGPSTQERAASGDDTASFQGDFLGTGQQDSGSSGFGSFVRGAVGSVLPAAGSLAGAGAGAEAGAEIGSVAGPWGAAAGGLVGGLVGGFGGSFGAARAQSYGLSKLPDSWVEALGQDDRQQRLDQEQHPYASFLGGLVPFALTMQPGIGGASAAAKALPENSTALQRLMVNPVTARLFSGALMGGMELGQEASEGNVDWNKVAISTGFGLVFNRPNRFGEAIEGSLVRPAARTLEAPPTEPQAPETPEEGLASYEHPPTLNEASAFGVGGPGASEETFFGSLQRDATAQENANATLREENATVGPMDEVDVDALARSSDRNLFIRYDQLKATRDALADRMRELRAPDDEEIQEAKSQIDDLQSRYEDVLAANNGHTGGVEQRRLRAQIRDAQRAHDDLMARKIADNEEPLRVATEQYQAADYAMRDIGPAAGAARRRAAERAGVEMVAPTPVETEPEDVVAAHPSADVTEQTPTLAETAKPVKPLPEQKAAIAADVKRQLVAAGRPEDQAEDVGTLTANHFAVLASQFKGALGTAEDIYRREGPEWRGVAPEPTAARAPLPSIEERVAELEAQPKAEPIPPIVKPRRAAKKAKAEEAKTEAPKISAEDARAKAKSLGVENLIDALQGAGASGKEIEAVIGKKMTADEIEAMRHSTAQGKADKARAEKQDAEVKAGIKKKSDGSEFSGTLHALHTSENDNLTAFEPDFAGDRYDGDGGSFGGQGVYLDSSGKFTSGEMDRFTVNHIYQTAVKFKKAFVLTPETATKLASLLEDRTGRFAETEALDKEYEKRASELGLGEDKIESWDDKHPFAERPVLDARRKLYDEEFRERDNELRTKIPSPGDDLVSNLKKLGYDGLIVKGFDPDADYSHLSKPFRDKGYLGPDHFFQDQTVAFNHSAVKIVRRVEKRPTSPEAEKAYSDALSHLNSLQDKFRTLAEAEDPSGDKGIYAMSQEVRDLYYDEIPAAREALYAASSKVHDELLPVDAWHKAQGARIGLEPEPEEAARPVEITFQGKTYTGATKLDAVMAAQRDTHVSMDQIWDSLSPDTFNQRPKTAKSEREKFGSYTRGEPRGLIRLFMGAANASTPIHELGHDFLERMKRYGSHERAPLQLRADWVTLKRALHIEDGATLIKRPAHEQFARWFEQYLYEGVAPSKELAGVFSRFKNWMANIYKNVRDIFDKRQVPMSADVRAVFDRMLAEEPHATVIAPEAARAPTLPDIHAIEAEKLSPAQALPAAERVAAERAEATPSPEVEHEIAPTLAEIKAERAGPGTDAAGETGLGDAGLRKVESGGGEAGHEPGGGGVGGAAGEKREGGDAAAAESVGAATGGPASTGRPQSGDPLRNAPLAPRPADILTAPQRFVDKAGNIRLDNVKDAEDLKECARELAASNNDFVGNRRGRLSDPEVMVLQAALGDDRVTRKTLGEAFNAEEAWAVQRIAAQAWREMHGAAQTYKQSRSEGDLLVYIEKQQRATMMQAYYSQATAEAGRALRAMRKVQEFWTAGAEAARGATEGAPKPKPGDVVAEATGRPLYQKAQEALLVAEYEDPQAAAKFNAWSRRHSFGRMLLEYWINGLISGTATHTTYLVGNVLLSMEKGLLETPVAAAIGALRPVMGREGGNVVRLGEVAARLRGGVSGYAPAAQAAFEAFRTGLTGTLPGHGEAFRLPFQPESAPQTGGARLNEQATMQDVKVALYGAWRGILDGTLSIGKILQAAPEGSPTFSTEYSHLGAIPNWRVGGGVIPVGTLARLPSRGIATIHTFMRALNYSMEKNAAIYRQALAEGEKAGWSEAQTHARMADLTNNTPEDIATNSSTAATELTLMGPAGEFTRKLSALTNWAPNIPGLGETPILKFIDPFVHIASNIIDQSIVQRTPAGLLSSEIRADLTGRNGVAAQDMAQARMIVGTALSLGFGALAAGGYVSGSGPMDRNKAAMWRLAGNQPHSVRIGDTWYAMNRLGPLGMLLGMSADMYDVAHSASQGDMLQAGAFLQHAITQNVLDESFMRGPAELIQAVEDPGRYGERYIQNFASSFVPMSVALAQMDRASDPFTRQARTVMDSIRAKVPGLSEQLFPRRDIWGQPIPNHDALVAAGLTAIYEQNMSQDPVNIALAGIGIGIAPVGRTIRNVKLTDQQYDDFARIAGRMAKQRLDVFVRSPDWQQWPPGVRVDAIKTIVEHCREAARGVIFMKFPQILADSTRQRMQKMGMAQ